MFSKQSISSLLISHINMFQSIILRLLEALFMSYHV